MFGQFSLAGDRVASLHLATRVFLEGNHTSDELRDRAIKETLSSFVADEDESDRKSDFTFSRECACLEFVFRSCGDVEDGRC